MDNTGHELGVDMHNPWPDKSDHKLKHHKRITKNKWNRIETWYLFYWSLNFLNSYSPYGAMCNPAKVGSRGPNKGQRLSQSFLSPFPPSTSFIFSLPAVRSTVKHTTSSWVLFGNAYRPRVTNAKDEIDNMRKCSIVGLLSNLNFSQPTKWILALGIKSH